MKKTILKSFRKPWNRSRIFIGCLLLLPFISSAQSGTGSFANGVNSTVTVAQVQTIKIPSSVNYRSSMKYVYFEYQETGQPVHRVTFVSTAASGTTADRVYNFHSSSLNYTPGSSVRFKTMKIQFASTL
ncbi:MAG: hypothetical protein J7604_16575 [Sporocytophaga sp.]|uniref:hypothetical protein n=1 Tax=Sporocytophaga sp. TaxID=2231183 RepID=UPI001B1F8031|nr:hypothetical protein [Sporocytophaga sp.]MBO9701824.1 hypothetical protein [Sporocytophaga sp.]